MIYNHITKLASWVFVSWLEINRVFYENFPRQTPKKEKQSIWKEQCFLMMGFVFILAQIFNWWAQSLEQGPYFVTVHEKSRAVFLRALACFAACFDCSCKRNLYWGVPRQACELGGEKCIWPKRVIRCLFVMDYPTSTHSLPWEFEGAQWVCGILRWVQQGKITFDKVNEKYVHRRIKIHLK